MVSARQVQHVFATQGITLSSEHVSNSRLIAQTLVPNTDTVKALVGLILYRSPDIARKAAASTPNLLAFAGGERTAKRVKIVRIGNFLALYEPRASYGRQVEAALSTLEQETAR
jgi:hypothetical protein